MTRLRMWTRSHKTAAALLVGAAILIALGATMGAATATDQPAFCRQACHEMSPYAHAWAEGPHRDVPCVDCHVDSGMVNRLSHKVVALGEVWSHVKGAPPFPLDDRSPVPSRRCITCHDSVSLQVTGFDHAEHAKRGECESCHFDAGHNVTDADLKAAGLFNPNAATERIKTKVATVDAGSANVPGHVQVTCTRCHDLAQTGCSACHAPGHEDSGPAAKNEKCTTCHSAGLTFAFNHPSNESAEACADCHAAPAKHRSGECSKCHSSTRKWSFSHPSSKAKCTDCHKAPSKHRAGDCTSCHSVGKSWAFKHPRTSGGCTECHDRPARHRAGSCSTCHRSTRSWSFTHPASGSSCTNCHSRPARHRAGSCTSCHRTGASWSFSHPGSGATCTNCHRRPSGHRSGSCATCHRTGVTWAFRHSGSTSCRSCHNAPSNHFGTSCASCHSPSRSWGSANFSHPRIRGGEHSYRSFACSKCHPNGYGSATCSRCHSSSTGPKDD